MTRDGYEVYMMYLALQRHFTTDYDYFKYNGKVRGSKESYQKRNDMWSFEKICKIIPENNRLDFMVANFLENPQCWVKNMDISHYNTYIERHKNITSIFKQDLERIKQEGPAKVMQVTQSYPKIYDMYIKKDITLETLVILNRIFPFVDKHVEQVQVPFVFPDIVKKIKNYEQFAINKIGERHELLVDVARSVLL